jgi:hypothetical protein
VGGFALFTFNQFRLSPSFTACWNVLYPTIPLEFFQLWISYGFPFFYVSFLLLLIVSFLFFAAVSSSFSSFFLLFLSLPFPETSAHFV